MFNRDMICDIKDFWCRQPLVYFLLTISVKILEGGL